MQRIDSNVAPASQVIIIGAPRSGTNMLRDLLCSLDEVATWPCDEINYIWRHGNIRHSSDAFTADMAEPWICDYIRHRFERVTEYDEAQIVVEKTCANSLRVPFIERVLVEPKYIFIYRDGMDAVGSAMSRWRAKLDLPYLMRKARFVPPTDLPYYAFRYLGNLLSQVRSSDGQLSTWGPVLPDMTQLKANHDLAELCAIQWQACVERSLDAFDEIPGERVLHVSYETLVKEKAHQAPRIAKFLGLDPVAIINSTVFNAINAVSVGKADSNMTPETRSRISRLIEPTMQRLGYR